MLTSTISFTGALVLLLSLQVLITALPISGYIWIRKTERYLASIDHRNQNENDCAGQGLYDCVIGSQAHSFPAMKPAAVVYPHDADAIPNATPTAITDTVAIPTASAEEVGPSMTTVASQKWLELQRRNDILEEIPPCPQSQDATLPGPTAVFNSAPNLKPCDNWGRCPKNYRTLAWAGYCECLGPFATPSATKHQGDTVFQDFGLD